MSKLITALFYDIGGREIYEDRVAVLELTTPGRLRVTVGLVADGVGGGNKGERAAQIAMETALHHMEHGSRAGNVPQLLQEAFAVASRAVLAEAPDTNSATTTLTIAAVHEGKTLYVANAGDSRVYLCRKGKLSQLTLDHSFANVMPWHSRMSAAAAAANPRADALVRYLGREEQVPADMGFYVGTTDQRVANERGCRGLALKQGDSVLVCSDGLVKERAPGRPLVTEDEIIHVLTTQEGDRAARSLVSFALGRGADDNVSVALLQTPDPQRRWRARRPFLRALALASILFFIALVFIKQSTDQQIASVQATARAGANQMATALAEKVAEQAQLMATSTAVIESQAIELESIQTAAAIEQGKVVATAEYEQTRIAEENACLLPQNYSYTVGRVTLVPEPVYSYVNGDAVRDDFAASWSITNTGLCPLIVTALLSLNGGQRITPALVQDGQEMDAIPVGETAELVVIYPVERPNDLFSLRERYNSGQEEWKLMVGQDGNSAVALVQQPTLVLNNPAIPRWILVIEAVTSPEPQPELLSPPPSPDPSDQSSDEGNETTTP